MHIQDIIKEGRPTLSFEFFPPKTPEAFDTLFATIVELEAYQPSFVSVTYGAGGSTRDLTHKLVVKIKTETSLRAIPHLTCVCHAEDEMREIIEGYAAADVGNILALGGDPPRDKPNYDRGQDAFEHAAGLVAFIKDFNASGKHPNAKGFGIGVAGFPEGHPDTPNRMLELDHLKEKVDAGADYIVTQLFFDNHDFYDFRERCELAGINVPIVAGIMPITSAKGMSRMAELAAGAKFSAKLLRAIKRAGGDEKSVERVGIHHATEQCRDLLDNDVAGIHFYTLNKSLATREIYANLGLRNSD
ncbi:MAG: methylenetetrahydrofolate reductase (NADPH) [Verrucomicrobiales bacterium]|jgi:methylenetetrahydrofolate reductase (NADPH)